MPLSDADIERYARQIVIPGIGAAGQERLLAAVVVVLGDDDGARQAALFLRAAGATVTTLAGDGCDAIVIAGVSALSQAQRLAVLAAEVPLCWYQITETGFSCGVHPQAALPEAAAPCGPLDEEILPALHQAAACDAAASACACIVGLPYRSGPHSIEVL